LFYAIIVPRYFDKSRLIHLVVLSLAFLIISPLLIDFALRMNKILYSMPASGTISIWGFLGGIFGSIITGGIGIFLRIMIDWFTDRQKKTELENKNLESELKLLKARLNPHFLFNTINNIDTLIAERPEKASELLSKLSDLLRYVLYDTETDKTELGDELTIIEKYIELQKIRISNPENVHLNINCDNLHFQIPPMLFLPFIENAFKHSDLNKPDQNITLELTCNKNQIKFMCKNDFIANDKPGGIGLELIRRRLELYFPNAFNLVINVNDVKYEVNLLININED
jgi:LytS/YehU family sensor histidine kinase